jgi:DNA-binding NarL/FixJ family response regulator
MSSTLYHRRYLMETNQDITVLFIDGDQEDRRTWTEAFKRSSPESVVLEADSGAAGLAVCRSQRVDCVIVEMSLPDMSGFQVLVDLIPYHHRPTVAVIMLTRLPLPPMAHFATQKGAHAFLMKSHTSTEQLKTAVLKAIATIAASGAEPPSGHEAGAGSSPSTTQI